MDRRFTRLAQQGPNVAATTVRVLGELARRAPDRWARRTMRSAVSGEASAVEALPLRSKAATAWWRSTEPGVATRSSLTERVFQCEDRSMTARLNDPPSDRVLLHEAESMRRSLSMSETLPRADVERVLDTCVSLLAERARIVRILDDLGGSWSDTRRALNDLSTLVRR